MTHFWIKVCDLMMRKKTHAFAETSERFDIDEEDILTPSKCMKI